MTIENYHSTLSYSSSLLNLDIYKYKQEVNGVVESPIFDALLTDHTHCIVLLSIAFRKETLFSKHSKELPFNQLHIQWENNHTVISWIDVSGYVSSSGRIVLIYKEVRIGWCMR